MSDQVSEVDEEKIITQATQPGTKAEREQQRAAEDFKRTQDGKPTMKVKVYSPFRDYYDGQAFSVTAENATGPFDILPHHHNFISLLNPCEVVIRTDQNQERRIRISGGIMHVKADSLIIFLDV